MLGEIFKIFGSVVVKTDEAESKLDDIVDKGEETESKMSNFFGGVAKAGALVVAGATVASGAAMSLAKGAAEQADKWDKLSLRTGIAVEELQRWGYAAGQSGADIAKLEVGIKTLSDAQMNAINGSEAQVEAFKKIGISIEELERMTPEQTFEAVMNGLADMADGAERNALGNDLLGRSFVELKPLLAEGSEGMQALKDRADELGLVMSEDAISAGVEFGDRMDDLRAIISMVGVNIASVLMPYLTYFINWCIENAPVVQGMIGGAVEFLANTFKWLGDNMNWILPIVTGLVAAFTAFKVINTVTGFVTVFKTAISGAQGVVGIFNAIMAMNPFTLWIIAIGALVGAITWLVLNWDQAGEFFANSWEFITNLFSVATEVVGTIIGNMVAAVAEWFGSMWETVKTKVSDIYDAVAEWFGKIPGKIQEIWDTAVDYLTSIDLFQVGKDIIQGLINGIGEMAGALWDKAGEIAGGVWDKFQSLFQFGSPSKKMRQAGRWTIQGSILGYEDEYENMLETADKLASAASFTAESNYTINKRVETIDEETTSEESVYRRQIPGVDVYNQRDTYSLFERMIELLEKILDKDSSIFMDNREVARTVQKPLEEYSKAIELRNRRMRGDW